MTKRVPFETLNGFMGAVKETRVVAQNNRLLLEEGLNVGLRMIKTAAQKKNKVILVGNGGSSAVASHQATDLCKNAKIKAVSFTDPSVLTCFANDYGYAHAYEKAIELHGDTGDLLLAISSSGSSENILNAVKAAKKKQITVMTFSGFDSDNPLSSAGDLNFYVPSPRYGTVEIAHLLLIHTMIDELVELKKIETQQSKTRRAPEAHA